MDRILKDVPTSDLLPLRSVCKVWNASALRLLQKRNDLTIYLDLTTLMNNDPYCFRSKDRKFLLRRVSLTLRWEEEWKATLRLQRFLELHHEHIVHLRASTPDFFRDVWNKWRLPKLETLVIESHGGYYDTQPQIPPYIAEKSSVTKLRLRPGCDRSFMDPLMAATPRLQELVIQQIWSNNTTTTLSRLTTTNLKVLDAFLRTLNGPEIINAFLCSPHSQGLEKLRIYFDYLSHPSFEIVIETPMPKLKELIIVYYKNITVLKYLGPGLFPQLEYLNLSLKILDEDSLSSQEGRFEKLRKLIITLRDVSEVGKLGKLLSMCETAEVVNVDVRCPGPLPACHLSVVNKTLLNSLTYFGKQKELGMLIGFDLDADEEGVVTCSNLDDIEWQLMKLKSLADKGKRVSLDSCVTPA